MYAVWEVVVEPHVVQGPNRSYPVARHESIVRAASTQDGSREARTVALDRAHTAAAVPPWRPYRRQGWPFSSARPFIDPNPARRTA